MTKTRFSVNPFPDVQVSKLERHELVDIVQMYVDDYINKYVKFVVVDKRKVDKRRWERVKSRDNIHVYAERTRKELRRRGVEPENSLSATQRVQDQSASTDLPVMMSVGTLLGELDDLMLGVVSPTIDDMLIKSSYVRDIDNASVLSSVMKPTKDDPFQSLTIKWMVIEVPLPRTKLVKSRDFVCIEATGITYLPNGDRVGYHLLHSIDFPQTNPLPNKVRGNLSVFSCFRSKRRHTIENFAWGLVDPGGDIMRSLVISVAARSLLSASSYVHCGQMKKLAWMVVRLHSPLDQDEQAHQVKQCVVCNKKMRYAMGTISQGTCQVCYGCVCFSCKIRHPLSFIASDGHLVQRKTVICAQCMNAATHWNAQEAARDEAAGHGTCTNYSAYSVVNTSASSLDD